MKLSIVTPILDSHEIVRRQVLHYRQMNLSQFDVEVIWVDDGSDPPLDVKDPGFNLKIYRTKDFRQWTEHVARNKGAQIATGTNLFMIDIDYIIPKATIEQAMEFDGDRMAISRRFGILDSEGAIRDDADTLRASGLKERWVRKGGVVGHRSQFVMRNHLFWNMGGYRENLTGQEHPRGGGAGQKFNALWRLWVKRGNAALSDDTASVFVWPTGKFINGGSLNPHGLFHTLDRQ